MALTRAEELELSGLAAPVLRAVKTKTLQRKVYVIKPDDPTWTPVSVTTGKEALRGLAKVMALEHAVQSDAREEETACQLCSNRFRIPPGQRGRPRKFCKTACNIACDGCGAAIVITSGKCRLRFNCAECNLAKARAQGMHGVKGRDRGGIWWDNLTDEERVAHRASRVDAYRQSQRVAGK